MTRTNMALLAVLSVGIIATMSTVPAFAESTLSLQGHFEGYDTEGDDYSGSFIDFGVYSHFDGAVVTEGVYEFVEDSQHADGGYYATKYTISDESGNSLSFYDIEVYFLEYGQGKFGMSHTEWTITGGEGKFSDATGEGKSRVFFSLDDMAYKGISSGTVILPS